ncbi:kiwellin-like [Nymphaea colorata]|nr:kiwellin-like [Nymphaea colorata]
MATAASFLNPLLALLSLLLICLFPSTLASSPCNGPCNSYDDCEGKLTCTNGRCTDDPDIGTHICTGAGSPSKDDGCNPTGSMMCNGVNYPTYTCSPPMSSSTDAILTVNNFSRGGDGGGPSECDGSYHDNTEQVVALSTGWFDHRRLCFQMIRITTDDGKSTTAKVVDECDSRNGCDPEHAGQQPCRNNIVDGSAAVWNALGLNTDDGEVHVTWSMA